MFPEGTIILVKPFRASSKGEYHHSHLQRRLTPGRQKFAVSLTLLLLVFSGSGLWPGATGASASTASTVAAFGAPFLGAPPTISPAVVAIAATTNGSGYYVLRSNGQVAAYGAPNYGALAPGSLPNGITATGIALDSKTGGYWIVTSSGIVRGFNAPYLGEHRIHSGGWGQYPAAVAIASAPDGAGYYVLRANGGINCFGVPFHGSLAGHLHYGATAPVVAVGIAVDPATGGYWIATSVGGVANFDAPFHGSPIADHHGWYSGAPVSAIAAATTADGGGYYLQRANGAVENFAATSYGSIAISRSMPIGGSAVGMAVDQVTGGYYEAIDATPLDGYLNPLRALTSLVPQEIDQGVDYCGSGPIYALGDGVVKNLYSNQWPSGVFISYQLNGGPAKGLYVYVAENVTPEVTIGEKVTPTTELGVLNDAKTCLETGWADPPASPERAMGHVEYNGKNSTAYGLNFSALLQALGARPGLPQPDGPPGPLAPRWPTW
jgi:hypothetical protein